MTEQTLFTRVVTHLRTQQGGGLNYVLRYSGAKVGSVDLARSQRDSPHTSCHEVLSGAHPSRVG